MLRRMLLASVNRSFRFSPANAGKSMLLYEWASMPKKTDLLHANNIVADQAALLRSLISAFVIRFMKHMVAILAPCGISRF